MAKSTTIEKIISSERDMPNNRTVTADLIGERERNGGGSEKYQETKPDETNEAKFTNIRTAQQAHAYRMDCTAENGTLLAK